MRAIYAICFTVIIKYCAFETLSACQVSAVVLWKYAVDLGNNRFAQTDFSSFFLDLKQARYCDLIEFSVVKNKNNKKLRVACLNPMPNTIDSTEFSIDLVFLWNDRYQGQCQRSSTKFSIRILIGYALGSVIYLGAFSRF